jgi:predicted metal-dependent HD superfamily phosphohydrolase
MTQPGTEIRAAWRHIAGHQPASHHHEGYIDDVLVRYAEPHRHYHTATHIMFVLRHLGDIARALDRQASAEVNAAALYHDAIYDPRAADNEERSAALAAADLAAIGWPPGRCATVATLIVATAGHLADPPTASTTAGPVTDTAMLLDADLAILGADPTAYQAYANGVRAEYSHVDDDQWTIGRAAVLQRFLGRGRLFLTEHMHAALDHRARANIEAELAALRAG